MAIINNNVQNVKFLRNQDVNITRDTAIARLNEHKADAADGTALLARYTVSGEVKTIVGFVYVTGSTHDITIFDTEGASADVEELKREINAKLGEGVTSDNTATAQLAALSGSTFVPGTSSSADTSVEGAKAYAKDYTDEQISSLDYTDTAVTGQYVSQVTQSDGKIAVTRVELPTVAAITEAGKPIIAVAEDNGAIAASAGTINAQYVDITDSGSLITATTVEGALAEIAAEIDGMDLAVVSGDGEVITAVSETDGKVSASKAAIKDVKLTGYVKNTTATGAISATDDIEDALSKLENTIGSNAISNADGSITVTPANGSTTDVKVHIKSGEKVIKLDGNGGGIYTNLNLVEITDETTLPAEIKVRYELRDSDGVKIGESIDIPKDSHIVSITYNESTQKLVYTYIDVEGETQTTEIDLSHLILETEFASGVTFSNGVAHGVVDPTSENFLTVGDNGFKLAGVQDAINTAISGLDATVGSTTIATDKHVAVEVVEVDGKLTALNINESNIADADDLATEITNRTNANTELSNRLGANVTTANTASAQLSALSGTSTDASGVTSVWGAKKYAQQYADEKVAAVVAGLDADVSGNTTHVTVNVVETDGVITGVNVAEDNIANASDLAALSAKTVTEVGSSNTSISATTASTANGTVSVDLVTDADKIQMSGFTADNTSALSGIATSDSIATAFEKTNTVITENERVTANALTDLDTRVKTVSGDVEALSAKTITSVTVNSNAVTVANGIAPISITPATTAVTATGNEAIVVNTDANGNITLGISSIDCGYYGGTQG